MSNADKQNQNTTETGSRTYTTPFGELPSVTSILKLYDNGKSGILIAWGCKLMGEYLQKQVNKTGDLHIPAPQVIDVLAEAKRQHKIYKKEAGDIGSEVHNVIEVYLCGQRVDHLVDANKMLKKPFEAFLEWYKSAGFTFIECEQQVCTNRFAGTLDGIAKDKKGDLWVIDFKSSNRIDSTYLWQIGAYRECARNGWMFSNDKWDRKMYKIEGGVGILRLDKVTGLPEWQPYTIDEADWGLECFNKLVDLWELTNKKEK